MKGQEKIFNEIFEDYAQNDQEYLDFEDYQKKAKKRMKRIIKKHALHIAHAILDEHYARYNNESIRTNTTH